MNFQDIKDKKTAVWGFGREGQTFVHLWQMRNPAKALSVIDEKPNSASAELADKLGIQYITPENLGDCLKEFDVIVKSPGISRYKKEIIQAKESGVIFTSLVDLWLNENSDKTVIAVTGTKGKSTTSSLITHLLRSLNIDAKLAGNVGIPLFSTDLECSQSETNKTIWVLELSSYQASDVTTSIPTAVLLNLYPEHSDWHGSVEQYYLDKLNIFRNQDSSSHAIINGEDPNTQKYLNYFSNPIYFNKPEAIHAHDGFFFQGEKKLFATSVFPLLGQHNANNVCAALTVLSTLGFDPIQAENGLRSFVGLPHRLQNLGTNNGLTFVDDSISTIPQAALAALNALSGKPITLLIGGQARAQEWDAFASALSEQLVSNIITMPSNGSEIAEVLRSLKAKGQLSGIQIYEAADLESAVNTAKRITPKGGIVLLSPASPSYDHFKNFEARGEAFKNFAFAGS